MAEFVFSQVDVFSRNALRGNPVAVVHNANGVDAQTMQAFAHWTNLSETTFLQAPTHPEADYALRIFTPGTELPFAGHPTLGSCHAWLESGGQPKNPDMIVQECGAGLARIRRAEERLWFAAPPLQRSGPLDDELLQRLLRATGLGADDVVDHQWVDNGPGWCALLLQDAERVLSLTPDFSQLKGVSLGVVGPIDDGPGDLEVRAFVPDMGVPEDPVTGSLNAGLAQWLMATGRVGDSYIACQGTALGREGRVYLQREGEAIWTGGDCRSVVSGNVAF